MHTVSLILVDGGAVCALLMLSVTYMHMNVVARTPSRLLCSLLLLLFCVSVGCRPVRAMCVRVVDVGVICITARQRIVLKHNASSARAKIINAE